MAERVPSTLLSATRQGWKLTVSTMALVGAGVAGGIQLLGPLEWKLIAADAAIASGIVGLATAMMIRCPSCRKSLGLWAMRTQRLMRWHDVLSNLQACPHCGRSAREGLETGKAP
jgi:hypothetical protein